MTEERPPAGQPATTPERAAGPGASTDKRGGSRTHGRDTARRLGVAALAAMAIVWAVLEFMPRHTPAGQPPLARGSIATLRTEFNGAAGSTRILALLSPT
jgi:hypothetical protein